LSAEKVAADILKSSCNIQMLRSLEETGDIFDPQRPILNLYHFSQVLMAYNSEALVKMQPYEVRSDGTTWPVGSYHCTETPKPVYMRMIDNRFEGCGYFGEPLSSASSVQPSSTMSAIVHIDIEPVIDTGVLIDTSASVLTSSTARKSTELTVKNFSESWKTLGTLVEMLHYWAAVLDLSSNKPLLSIAASLVSELSKLGTRVFEVLTNIQDKTTIAEKKAFLAITKHIKQELDRRAKQREDEDAKQKDDEDEEDGEDGEDDEDEEVDEDDEHIEDNLRKDNKQEQNTQVKEEDEAAKQKEREDAEQKEREEAKVILTVYAEQDRYDSSHPQRGRHSDIEHEQRFYQQ
jgi:hypothetical protein